ncbi:hypothetical protein FRB93_012804 [Tulasnella sp. JGI-2019a]|nr:hypothetical protein FRB93_012804 [Tulasnella sp. JGI-2019a]
MSDTRGSSGMVTPSTHTFLPPSVSDMRVPSHMVVPSQMPVSTTGQSVTFPLATSRGSRTSNWTFGTAAPSSSMPSGHSANHNRQPQTTAPAASAAGAYLPPLLSSEGADSFHSAAPMTGAGSIQINDMSTQLSTQQKQKRPDEWINPDFLR